MGIVKRQGIKATIVGYIGVLLGAFNLLFLYPACLSPSEIGLINLLVDTATLFLPFLVLGGTAIAVRYFPYYKDPAHGHHGFLTLLLGIPSLLLFVFALLFFGGSEWLSAQFSGKSPLFYRYFGLVLPLTVFLTYHTILEAYCRSLQRIVVNNLLREVFLRVASAILALLYFWHWLNTDLFVAWYVAMYAIILLLLTLYVWQQGQLHLVRINPGRITTKARREMLVYGVFILLGTLGGTVVYKIDTLMIGKYLGEADSGIYRVAYFIGLVVEMPRRALSQIAAPLVADAMRHEDIPHIADLYKRVGINQFIVGLLLFVGIWCNADNLFALMPNGGLFAGGKWVIFWVGITKVTDMVTSINEEIIGFSPYYRYTMLFMLVLIGVSIGLNWWLILSMGITGAAMAAAICLIAYNFFKCLLIYVKYDIHPFGMGSFKTLFVGIVSGIIGMTMPILPNTLADIIVRSLLIGVTFVLLIWKLRASPDLNEMTDKLLKKIISH